MNHKQPTLKIMYKHWPLKKSLFLVTVATFDMITDLKEDRQRTTPDMFHLTWHSGYRGIY
jgi:hypothetical protein